MGIHYNPQQQHLNVGLPPQCKDGGYFIFITLNKEELDPAHNYADELFADQFIWVTRRDVTEDQKDYVNLRLPETRVSLFVRTNSQEEFCIRRGAEIPGAHVIQRSFDRPVNPEVGGACHDIFTARSS